MAKRTSKYPKFHKLGHEKSNDMINQLPDEILVKIVSLLTIREAGRTSVLSKRWRSLWTFTTGSLNFDALKTLHEIRQKVNLRNEERLKYVSWVNQVSKSHRGPTIDEFKVWFDLDKTFACDIDSWIDFAFAKRVQRLDLDFETFVSLDFAFVKQYTFPHECYIHIKTPSGLASIKSLTSLCLRHVNVSGEVLEHFLSNCPLLERLYVSASDQLGNLKVAGSSLQLKFIEIRICALENVEISAPNLVSFKYFGRRIRLNISNVPRLVDVSIGGADYEPISSALCTLSSYLSQLETLKLDFFLCMFRERMVFPQFPELRKLRHLIWKVRARDTSSLLSYTSLMKASPILDRFTLELEWLDYSAERKIEKAARFPHQYLKVVEIVGFVGRSFDVELVMYFLENASTLEKLIINPHPTPFYGIPEEETEEMKAARKRAMQLKSKLPQGAELVIL